MGKPWTEARKVETAAKKLEAKERDELGPLFSDQAETIDRERLKVARRQGHSHNLEHLNTVTGPATDLLAVLALMELEALASGSMPMQMFEKLRAKIRDVWPNEKYQYSIWLGILSGERWVTTEYGWVDDPKVKFGGAAGPGKRLVTVERLPPEDWKAPFDKEWKKTWFWRRCDSCRRWHAPGQISCREAGEMSCEETDLILSRIGG